MNVEFLLEKRIHRAIQIEWKSGGTSNAQLAIKIKAQRAVEEEVDLGPADPEWFRAVRIKESFCSAWIVIVRHEDMVSQRIWNAILTLHPQTDTMPAEFTMSTTHENPPTSNEEIQEIHG